MSKIYRTKEQILKKAETITLKSLRSLIPENDITTIESQLSSYRNNRKGFLGDLVEKYFFEINPGNLSEPDFIESQVELKTAPLKKHNKKVFVAKERLVFSMINYNTISTERWESSSFLKKNTNLLLMFYLWSKTQSILDYEFLFVHLLNLLEDISQQDVLQIKKDWEYIVGKIKNGKAHLLSEADTYYLGACTKAATSRVLRDQPMNQIQAKPRAFSLKPQYVNYIIQTKILKLEGGTDSIFKTLKKVETIETALEIIFKPYIGKTDSEILVQLNSKLESKAKSYKRLIVNEILNTETGKIEELEKANITMKVITLENNGTLTESISFPAFDYIDLSKQVWEDEDHEIMADFHSQLETKKFLFVIFQKQLGKKEIVLKKIRFWNFPMGDIAEVERVWEKTVISIKEGRYNDLPKLKDSKVAHVRPHGRNRNDKIKTPQGTFETRKSFWLNAKYIQQAIS